MYCNPCLAYAFIRVRTCCGTSKLILFVIFAWLDRFGGETADHETADSLLYTKTYSCVRIYFTSLIRAVYIVTRCRYNLDIRIMLSTESKSIIGLQNTPLINIRPSGEVLHSDLFNVSYYNYYYRHTLILRSAHAADIRMHVSNNNL